MNALICGVSGQDGTYLAKFLLAKGYTVFGTSRDIYATNYSHLDYLNIKDKLQLLSMDITDFRSVLYVIAKVKPDEIYNLAGQTSVSMSYEQPAIAMESIAVATLNLLEAIKFINPSIKYYGAGSSDCFGDTGDNFADEHTPFKPRSPYGVAKTTAHNLVQNYRDSYGLHASTGILFNHESPLRSERFVTKKIVMAAARIGLGVACQLRLGNLNISRDWGWAPEYVDAMWRMLQQNTPTDYVVATGVSIRLEEFVEKSFSYFDLDWKNYVEIDESLFRPSDIMMSRGNPKKAYDELGWVASTNVYKVIENMCSYAEKNLHKKQ